MDGAAFGDLTALDTTTRQGLLRIAMTARAVLQETRHINLDPVTLEHLSVQQGRVLGQLRGLLPLEFHSELDVIADLVHPGATEPELRVAQGELVGWLEGLFDGIRATQIAEMAAGAIERASPDGVTDGRPAPGQYI